MYYKPAEFHFLHQEGLVSLTSWALGFLCSKRHRMVFVVQLLSSSLLALLFLLKEGDENGDLD